MFLPDGQPAGADVIVALDGRNVVTDGSGRFTHFEVPAGSFMLTASDPDTGYVAQARGTVAPGVTAEMPLRLLGKGSVSVEVRGVNGPIAAAQVRVRGGSFPNDEREGFTDGNGRVTFTGGDALSEGSFSASAFNQVSLVAGYTSSTVVRDAQVDVLIQLPDEAGIVEGRFLTVLMRLSGTRRFACRRSAATHLRPRLAMALSASKVCEEATSRLKRSIR